MWSGFKYDHEASVGNGTKIYRPDHFVPVLRKIPVETVTIDDGHNQTRKEITSEKHRINDIHIPKMFASWNKLKKIVPKRRKSSDEFEPIITTKDPIYGEVDNRGFLDIPGELKMLLKNVDNPSVLPPGKFSNRKFVVANPNFEKKDGNDTNPR